MGCKDRVRDENGNSCEYFGNGGFCNFEHNEFYHCVDWMASGKYHLSKSQVDDWERCPYKWHLGNVLGVRVRAELKSLALRQGAYFANLMAEKKDDTVWAKDEEEFKVIVEFMVEYIRENELMPFKNLRWEVRKERDGLQGVIDCELIDDKTTFGEMKFTANPDFYLNNPMARNQLEYYFSIVPEYKNAIILPVKNPIAKKSRSKKKDESTESRIERAKNDVIKRPGFYFPGLKPDKKPFRWGRHFSHLEFDAVELYKKIKWVRREIMIACADDYFVQKTANCLSPFPCDYLPIYDTGTINYELFERKGRKFRNRSDTKKSLTQEAEEQVLLAKLQLEDRGMVYE